MFAVIICQSFCLKNELESQKITTVKQTGKSSWRGKLYAH